MSQKRKADELDTEFEETEMSWSRHGQRQKKSQEMIPDQEEDEKNTVVIEDDDWIDNDLWNSDEST